MAVMIRVTSFIAEYRQRVSVERGKNLSAAHASPTRGGDPAVEGRDRDAEILGHIPRRRPALQELASRLYFPRRHPALAATDPAPSPRRGQAGPGAFGQQFRLHLRQ